MKQPAWARKHRAYGTGPDMTGSGLGLDPDADDVGQSFSGDPLQSTGGNCSTAPPARSRAAQGRRLVTTCAPTPPRQALSGSMLTLRHGDAG